MAAPLPSLNRWILCLVLASACGTSGRPRPEPAPPRLKDSSAEKVAGQRASMTNLELEADDQRWGVDAARERRRRADEATAKKRTGTLPDGPLDLRPSTPVRDTAPATNKTPPARNQAP